MLRMFDQSSCNGAIAEDASNAYKMNAEPGGKEETKIKHV